MMLSEDATADLPLLIGGERRSAERGAEFTVVSPVTGAPVARVAAAGASDARHTIDAAASAFGRWRDTSFVQRRMILLRAADILEQDAQTHRLAFALETGSTAAWAAMNVAGATLREAAGLASSPTGEILPSEHPGTVVESRREPAGVALVMVPWNAPTVLAARACAIALAVGDTVVLRPSELAPFTAGHLLADALTRAGAPDGVVNVVTTAPADAPGVIEAMIADPRLRRVVFIGSTPVGRRIAAVAARHLTPVVLELGGKNATILREDADLERWLPAVAFAAFANSGQICMSTDRLIVPAIPRWRSVR